MTDLPAVSIVICTYNRCEQLKDAIRNVLAMESRHNWELIVVDNASTDDTRGFLSTVAAADASVRYVYEAQKGLGAARDTAWRIARAPIICFMDDDCYPAVDFVDRIIQVFSEDAKIGFLGGMITLFDPTDAEVTIDLRPNAVVIPPSKFLATGVLRGANLSFRRDVLEKIGGFDRNLGAGTPFPFEDIDVIIAASAAGFWGLYDPRPRVAHHHRRKIVDATELRMSYDKGRGAYYMKYILKGDTVLPFLYGWFKQTIRDRDLARLGRELRSAKDYLQWRRSVVRKAEA